MSSRFVVAAAGAILVVLGLVPKAAALVACIPPPVLGGAGVVMFGTVAATVASPDVFAQLPDALRIPMSSGIMLGSVVVIALHALLGEPTPPHAGS